MSVSNTRKYTASLGDQIAETLAKIQLIESEREAQSATDRAAMEENAKTISSLKNDVKNISKDLADANNRDEKLVEAAFCNRGVEKLAYRSKSVKEVLETIQEKKAVEVQQCDAQKHDNNSLQSRLEELEMEYERRDQLAQRYAENKDDDDDVKRSLEVEVEHVIAMDKEADKTTANYLTMKTNIQDASRALESEIDALMEELQKQREDLEHLQKIEEDATATRENSKVELQQLQGQHHSEQMERARTLESYRIDDQTACSSLQWDDESDEALDSVAVMAEDGEENDLSHFQMVFRSLREVTGATSIQEVVDRFIFQKEKAKQLLIEKDENEAALQQLEEQQTLQRKHKDNIKHSGEAELCSDGQTQEELNEKLLAEQKKLDPAKDSWLFGTMSAARAGVEHLSHKLHVSVCEDVDPDSEEFVVLLMAQVKLGIQKMFTELQGTDMAAVLKEAEEEQFLIKVEEALPSYDTQIKLPDDGPQDSEDEEDDDSEDDD